MNTLDIDAIRSMMQGGRAKEYEPMLYPEKLPRMPVGTCFDSCFQLAQQYGYGYVEGLARPAHLDGWILHAWLTDGEHAIDPTWIAFTSKKKQVLLPVEYIGIEMDIKHVAQFVNDTGYQGVLANKWRAPELAERIINSGAKI
jgi:hypothetical protein